MGRERCRLSNAKEFSDSAGNGHARNRSANSAKQTRTTPHAARNRIYIRAESKVSHFFRLFHNSFALYGCNLQREISGQSVKGLEGRR